MSSRKPNKNFYRRFKIKISGKPNDIAMIKEVIKRRFKHKEWPCPDLILIDGGRAQLNAVKSELPEELRLFLKKGGAAGKKDEVFHPTAHPVPPPHAGSSGNCWQKLLHSGRFGFTRHGLGGGGLIIISHPPGGGSSSLMWIPNIETLSRHYRTYAVDNIYDFGRSVYSREFTGADDFTVWLDELLDSLGLENDVNMAGLSYGGWLAGEYALRHPGRIRKAVLLAPAATILPLSSIASDWTVPL